MLTFLLSMLIYLNPGLSYPQAATLSEQLVDAARSNDIDPILFASLVYHESGFVRTRVSPAGAFGLAQLHPAYHLDVRGKGDWANLYRGATVLAAYRKKCGGEWRAVAAYRSGQCTTVGPQTKKVFKTQRQWAARYAGMLRHASKR